MSLRKTFIRQRLAKPILFGFIKGFSWVALLRGSTRLLAIVKIAVIARILSPADVGLYGLAFLVISLLEVFTETGVNVFLIQEKKKLKEFVDTAWVVSIYRGILISLLILICSPLIVNFFSAPDLFELLILVALVPLLRGFINPSIVKFQKEMNFKADFWFRFTIFMADAVSAIAITWITRSPVGLIWGLIIGAFVEIFLSFLFVSPRPRFKFNHNQTLLIINRGKWITGTGIFQYLFKEGDDIFVGRFLGEGPLGIYQYAYKIATLPISEVGDVFGKVAFPLYVQIAEDKKRLKKVYMLSTLAILMIVLPFALLLILFSDQVVLLLLGEQWLAASVILKVVAVYAVIKASTEPAIRVFLAIKKQEYTSVITLVSLVVLAVCIYPLSQTYGLVGVGLSTIIASLSSLPVVGYYVFKVFKNV